jgi:glutamine amidotransferase
LSSAGQAALIACRRSAIIRLPSMCRVLAYLGRPLPLADVLFETDNSLTRQTHDPRMTAMLNLAGFGLAAWDPDSIRPDEPLVYRTTTLPVFDRNLRSIARKLAPTCVLAHVRGVELGVHDMVDERSLHPFHWPGTRVAFAHNGHLRDFERMRFSLVPYIRAELQERLEGVGDTEWLYALLLSQLRDPHALPEGDELADATVRTLEIVRHVRELHGIDTSSPTNLFASTGHSLVATRFSYDYGWYPDADSLLEVDLPFVSLWYTLGDGYALRDGEWTTLVDGTVTSLVLASEPLTVDDSTWLEVPEYALLTASRDGDDLRMELRDLDV